MVNQENPKCVRILVITDVEAMEIQGLIPFDAWEIFDWYPPDSWGKSSWTSSVKDCDSVSQASCGGIEAVNPAYISCRILGLSGRQTQASIEYDCDYQNMPCIDSP